MKLEYRKSTPARAQTWFAQFPPRQAQQLLDQLSKWHAEISEASVLGTDRDRDLWQIATEPDAKTWHRAQQHRNQPNTMLSVLAGAIEKLRSGYDLTEKQLDHVQKISAVMHHYGAPRLEITEAKSQQHRGHSLQDLRDQLFYYG